jgi:hypothetical protein
VLALEYPMHQMPCAICCLITYLSHSRHVSKLCFLPQHNASPNYFTSQHLSMPLTCCHFCWHSLENNEFNDNSANTVAEALVHSNIRSLK